MFYQRFRPIGLTWIYVVIIYSICLFIPLTFPLYVSTAIAMILVLGKKEKRLAFPLSLPSKAPTAIYYSSFQVQVRKETAEERLWPYNSACTKERKRGTVGSQSCCVRCRGHWRAYICEVLHPAGEDRSEPRRRRELSRR